MTAMSRFHVSQPHIEQTSRVVHIVGPWKPTSVEEHVSDSGGLGVDLEGMSTKDDTLDDDPVGVDR